MIRECKVCGASYETCSICEKNKSWRTHADTLTHYYILCVLMEYRTTHDKSCAREALARHGIENSNAEYKPDVQVLLEDIFA